VSIGAPRHGERRRGGTGQTGRDDDPDLAWVEPTLRQDDAEQNTDRARRERAQERRGVDDAPVGRAATALRSSGR
jgi:hypothetical protein